MAYKRQLLVNEEDQRLLVDEQDGDEAPTRKESDPTGMKEIPGVPDSSPSLEITRKHSQPSKWFKVFRYTLGIGAFVLLFAFLVAAIVLVVLSPPCSNLTNDNLLWWKTTVIYQCYPRSFKDTNGDGNGDLKGILNKTLYLYELGVNAVWLNPIFKSPQRDNGYDISNYTDVDPLYGTIDDLKSLLGLMHDKKMHLILDLVPNHTSEKHPWFVESRSSLNNSKRDWYVWADASSDGGPPNNWLSLFGGSAWSLDKNTHQYYLHQFSEFQPDLNYHNEAVRKAMEDVIRFWFDFGVDGLRIDAVIFLLEDPKLHDEAENKNFTDKYNCTAFKNNNTHCYDRLIHNLTKDFTGIHDIIRGWRKVADNYTDRFLVGETYDPVDVVMTYYGKDNDEFHFPFNFLLLSNNNWTGSHVNDTVSMWMDALPKGAWPNWVLGNHDNPRIASKAGNYLARALNVLLLTLPGTSTTYYGEEIFMTDVYVPPDERHDLYQNRDQERTPMQWKNVTYAGFTDGGKKPWLPVATNYSTYNVDTESRNSSSMLKLYKQVVNLISTQEAFRFAEYEAIMSNLNLFAYRRFHNGTKEEFVVVVNFSQSNTSVDLSAIQDSFHGPQILLSSADTKRDGNKVNLSKVSMTAGEAIIIKGDSDSLGC